LLSKAPFKKLKIIGKTMGFKDMLKKSFGKNERFKEMQEEDRLQTLLEERKKNSNERELEKFYEEERQEKIKQQLEKFREKRRNEVWRGNDILKQKNIFKDHANILKQDRSILDGKNLFMERGNWLKGGSGL
jgi:flagellar biosynthesis/type III secretory pathway protein FliH